MEHENWVARDYKIRLCTGLCKRCPNMVAQENGVDKKIWCVFVYFIKYWNLIKQIKLG